VLHRGGERRGFGQIWPSASPNAPTRLCEASALRVQRAQPHSTSRIAARWRLRRRRWLIRLPMALSDARRRSSATACLRRAATHLQVRATRRRLAQR
jgi:hypothetical protein